MSTVTLQINIPPQNCSIVVSPLQGIALETIFTIQYLYCSDEDLPLTYQFFYYNTADDVKQEINSTWNISRRQIKDQTINKSIQTVLTQGNLVIMAQVMDSQLGITNQTLSIQVSQQNKLIDQYYLSVNQFLDQKSQFSTQIADMLVAQCIAGEGVSKSTQFQFSQKLNTLQQMLITNIQNLSFQIPNFSLLSTFANKVIAQLSQQLFTSQLQDWSIQKSQTFQQLQIIMRQTQQSFLLNNQSPLQQNNDVQIQNIVDSFKILNSIVSVDTQNSLTDFQNYESISNQLAMMFSNISLPNQGETVLKGNLLTLLSDKITLKNIHKYALSTREYPTRNQTQIFSISRNKYEENIYYRNFSLTLPSRIAEFISVFTKMAFGIFKMPSVRIAERPRSYGLQQNLKIMYQFENATSSKKYKMACIQQNDPAAFGEQGLINIENLKNVYLYLLFWVFFTFTITYIALACVGIFLDKNTIKRRFLQVQQELPINGQHNQQQAENQQQEVQQIINDQQQKNYPITQQYSNCYHKLFCPQDIFLFDNFYIQEQQLSETGKTAVESKLIYPSLFDIFFNITFIPGMYHCIFHQYFGPYLLLEVQQQRIILEDIQSFRSEV
ncbi:hypothetical protein ABPG72_015962 [Tetrahymena utriculariae]